MVIPYPTKPFPNEIIPYEMTSLELRTFRLAKERRESKYGIMIWRMYRFGKINRTDVEREFGRYYKFKQCCIDNFVNIFKFGKDPGAYMDFLFGKSALYDKANHVLCFGCRIMRR